MRVKPQKNCFYQYFYHICILYSSLFKGIVHLKLKFYGWMQRNILPLRKYMFFTNTTFIVTRPLKWKYYVLTEGATLMTPPWHQDWPSLLIAPPFSVSLPLWLTAFNCCTHSAASCFWFRRFDVQTGCFTLSSCICQIFPTRHNSCIWVLFYMQATFTRCFALTVYGEKWTSAGRHRCAQVVTVIYKGKVVYRCAYVGFCLNIFWCMRTYTFDPMHSFINEAPASLLLDIFLTWCQSRPRSPSTD